MFAAARARDLWDVLRPVLFSNLQFACRIHMCFLARQCFFFVCAVQFCFETQRGTLAATLLCGRVKLCDHAPLLCEQLAMQAKLLFCIVFSLEPFSRGPTIYS